MEDIKRLIEDALFDVRPYVEYYDELRKLVESLLGECPDVESLMEKLEEKAATEGEPFKTDIKILLQRLEASF
ncbi:hypothetical protein E3E29_04450 [Thermococcus sp. Bubb.Bath]|nr:hypothetical protein [Thermococcus sp. Bubb.Bath]